MIKLKKIIKESYLDRKFGEPLPTFDSVMKDHQLGKVYTDKDRPSFKTSKQIEKEPVTESIKVIPSNKIDSKTWRSMKYDLRDQFDELVKIGQNYQVFQNAKGTARILKQIKRLMDHI